MPDDAAIEKSQLLQALGAEVERLRPVSITHPDHFVNVARRRAASRENAIFADQFENSANFRAHLKTGEEIWQQTRGIVDAFVSGAGTGGTIAGISCYLKSKNPNITVCLVDPPGSSLYNRVTRGVAFAPEESEGTRLRHPFDTVTEGIGLNRLTGNFKKAKIDVAFRGTDTEAVEMAAYLLRNEGLFVGSSAAMNCVGAVKLARHIMKKKKKKTATGGGDINNTHTPPPPPPVIVTILCDGGQRHLSKFHNAKYLESHGLTPVHTGKDLDFIK
jgi:cysteine synthase